MRTPDFLVVGAARSGTTSLHSYLSQHPQLFLPGIKEPCFFAFEGEKEKYLKGKFSFAVRDFEQYGKLFDKAGAGQKIGEMSTPYLYLYEKSIGTMKKYFPDYSKIKIVVMLRNPVDRAFSQYMWKIRDGRESLSFEDALKAEKERMLQNFSFDYFYADRGFYFNAVKAYLENFQHVHIIFFEDFSSAPQVVLRELCSFLGINTEFEFNSVSSQNDSGRPKSKWLAKAMTAESRAKFRIWYALPDKSRKRIRNLFSRLNKNTSETVVMKASTRAKLVDLYRDDILALQALLQRNLSSWLK